MVFYVTISLLLIFINQIYFLKYVYLYQLESYDILHFIKIIFKRYDLLDYVFYISNIVLFVLSVMFDCETLLLILCIENLVIFAVKLSKYCKNYSNSKIKFKYTKRVLRNNLLFIIIEFMTISIVFTTKIYLLLSILVVNLLTFLISSILIIPIEKTIYNQYIKKAQKVIDNNKNIKIIAITGSYGKTSVKNILYEILSQKYNVLATPMSYNTPMGICKCVLSELKPFHEYLILEFGAKRVGEIKYLCDKFKPNYAIISSIGPQHLETFGSIENIVKTKMELFDFIDEKSNCVCNISNSYICEYFESHHCDCLKVDFADNGCVCDKTIKNTLQILEIKCTKNGSYFTICCNNEIEKYNTKLIGAHNVVNVCLAIAMSKKIGLSYGQIVQGLSNVSSIKHRLEIKDMGEYLLIDNSYNSNPSSFRCAIDALCLFSDLIKVVITPGVIDQGVNAYKANFDLGKYMANKVDYVYVVNKTNRLALLDGLNCGEMEDERIIVVDSFSDINFRDFGEGEVVLIENDLPDNFV